jgi:DNA repair protein RadC
MGKTSADSGDCEPDRRLIIHGEAMLTDAELLAVCLRTGVSGTPVNQFAEELLESFGGLPGLLDAPVEALGYHRGLGQAKIATLKAILALAERYYLGTVATARLMAGSDQVLTFLRAQFAGARREIFACLFLDTRHRLIEFEKLFYGSIDKATVHPREIARRALELNAAAIVLAHNHPSGVAEPSVADLNLTQSLVKLLKQLDIVVLDHVVIGSGYGVSFAERGLI